jgi:hypothetical protein
VTLNIISVDGNVINFISTDNDYPCLPKTINISIDELKTEIRLIKNITNTKLPLDL